MIVHEFRKRATSPGRVARQIFCGCTPLRGHSRSLRRLGAPKALGPPCSAGATARRPSARCQSSRPRTAEPADGGASRKNRFGKMIPRRPSLVCFGTCLPPTSHGVPQQRHAPCHGASPAVSATSPWSRHRKPVWMPTLVNALRAALNGTLNSQTRVPDRNAFFKSPS